MTLGYMSRQSAHMNFLNFKIEESKWSQNEAWTVVRKVMLIIGL